MPGNFLDLPRELRDHIYELALVDQDYINLGTWIYPRSLSPQLLRTNKTIHHEATSLLYTHNRFYFPTWWDPERLASFRDQIGSDNAKHVRHICIDFPMSPSLDPGDVTFRDASVLFEMIKSCFPGLSTLTTSLPSAVELRLNALDNSKIAEALKLVDTRFRAISSLQEIIVEVYEDGPSDHLKREMNNYGWKISIIENAEEEDFDRSFSDSEDGDYGYEDYTWEYDDYDIDNDSDFWRRAGD